MKYSLSSHHFLYPTLEVFHGAVKIKRTKKTDQEENTNKGRQLRGNTTANTTIRSVEVTSTQKLSILKLENYDSLSVKLWWRKFVHSVKMTKEMDIIGHDEL